jgi:Glycosyltransferase family 87
VCLHRVMRPSVVATQSDRCTDPWAGRAALLAMTVGAGLALVAMPHDVRGGPGMALAVVGTAGALWLAHLEQGDPRLSRGVLTGAIALLAVVAVLTPPHGSTDMWSYVMYGRVLAVHHASPYLHAPASYQADPFLHRVSSGWRSARCVYGPVFVGIAALIALVAGHSAVAARIGFQGMEALAVVAALLVVGRVTRSRASVLWLGLQPIVWLSAVNGGHNDALVGLGVLVAAVVASRRRVALAGAVLAAAALVKVTALLALVGVVPWVFTAYGRKEALRLLGVCAGIVATATVLLPASLHVLASSDHRVSRASAWNVVRLWLVPVGAHRGTGAPLDVLLLAAGLAVLVLACALGFVFRREPDPFPGAGAAAASYMAVGAYVLPWYAMWSLPSLAATTRRTFASVAAAGYGLLLAAYELPQSHPHSAWDPLFRDIVTRVLPVPVAVAFVVAAIVGARRARGHAPLLAR